MSEELLTALLHWSSLFTRRSLDDFMAFTRESGLSMTQMHVLLRLYYHGDCDVTRLDQAMQVSKAAASQMVERLVQQGWVQRSAVPGDRRSRLVSLTDKGRKIVESSIQSRQSWVTDVAAVLNPQDIEPILHALNTLILASRQVEENVKSINKPTTAHFAG
jgi:DNA-binding MarR family transcriptional regulator